MKFLDIAKIYIKSGSGGSGALSFRREKFIEKGGPDGGDGGRGGAVILLPDEALNTLIDFRFRQHHFADNGKQGQGKRKTGVSGKDIFIKVPLGTEVWDETQEILLGEITTLEDKLLLAVGGSGGLGNHHFKSSTNRAPRKFTKGEKGIEKVLWLKLKLIADLGMLGLPNAGKSTFLSVTSKAKPKIADYPFTTLKPKLGVVSAANIVMVLADIPGLIKGAHEGKGAGIKFLGHIERCKVLIHLLDATSLEVDTDYKIVLNELYKYDSTLLNKPRITVLNKIDALQKKVLKEKLKIIQKYENQVYAISAVKGIGLDEVLLEASRQITSEASESDDHFKIKKPWNPTDH